MLKKIAHNTTIPSLGGNKDLRPLQDLITAEKVVLITLQKLSVDVTKAADALRVWGAGEGEDLGDILGASTTVLGHFAAALSGYATREHAIRDQLKAVRTREEALDDLKRRRKAELARADSAEKKLNKMGPEHKNLPAQTDLLAQLQAKIRGMDGEIMNEEAALGDFKRTSARSFMGLKFGGLMECCEKGCVAAECGRAIVTEISEETTQPGLARAMYMGHQRTQQHVSEAERAVSQIVFSALPPSGGGAPRLTTNFVGGDTDSMSNLPGGMQGGFNPQFTGTDSITMQNTGMGSTYDGGAGSGFLPPPDVGGNFADGRASPGSSFTGIYQPPPGSPGGYAPPGGYAAPSPGGYAPPPPMEESYSYASQGGYAPSAPGGTDAYTPPAPEKAREDFGGDAGLSSTGVAPGATGPAGGRFATFPVRGRGYSRSDDLGGAGQSQSGFAVADPPPSLGAMSRKDTSGSDFMSAVLDAGEFGARPGGTQGQGQMQSASQAAQMSKFQERERDRMQRERDEDEPVPEYRDYEPASQYDYPGAGVGVGAGSTSLPPGPPPGAAAPVVGGVWVSERERAPGLMAEEGGADRKSTVSEDISLAYMNMADDEALLPGENEQQRQARLSKHVRFGGEGVFGEDVPPSTMKRQDSSPPALNKGKRVPPPTMDPEADERALNAAAAREITRELDALNSGPPAPPPQQAQGNDQGWEFATTSGMREQPPSPPKVPAISTSPVREFGSPSREQQPTSPQNQYAQAPSPNRSYTASPPTQYAPSPVVQEPAPRIPPVTSRAGTLDTSVPGHQATPSWDASASAGAEPKPVAPGHHATPSWALPASGEGAGSPSASASPRLDAPYRAPFSNRSTSSLNLQAQAPPGARTISAAAFRRPQKTAVGGGELADTSPLAPKKRLPTSPYPQQRAPGSGLRDAPPMQPSPAQQQGDDTGFDYISAYERDSQAFFDDGSPMGGDFDYGRLGKVQVVGGMPASPGFPERRGGEPDPDGVR